MMKKPFKSNRIYKNRLITAVLCAALLLPIITGCTVTVKPHAADSGTIADSGNNPDHSAAGNAGNFTFAGKTYSSSYLMVGLPDALEAVNITADKVTGGYTAPETVFTVKTSSKISTDELKKYINVSPSFSFDLSKKDDTTFTVTPSDPLDSGTLYRFTVGDSTHPQSSFVFQTDSALIVKSVLPADLSVSVPVNTGIEINFSEPLQTGINIKDYFYITPETDGEYMTYPDGKTVVFVPKDYLLENTVYNISILRNLPSFSGKLLSDDFKTAFRTSSDVAVEAQGELMFSLESYEPQFTTDETPVIKYYYSAWNRSDSYTLNDTKVTLYRYASAADIIDAMKLYESVKADYLYGGEPYIFPSDGLAEVGSYDIKPETAEGNQVQYNGYLTLPAAGEGAYLVNITFRSQVDGEDKEFFDQAIMQISDLIVYTESSGENMLVWVNDASVDKTVEGADVTAEMFTRNDSWNLAPAGTAPVYVTKNAVTGSDGLCFIETDGTSSAYMLVKKDGHSVYICASAYGYSNAGSWFSYLFTDRETYFSNDTVNFWGMIAPKNGGVKLPETLYLTLGTSKTADKITVLPDGSFSGSFAIEDNAGWGIYMNFADSAGNTVTAKYINITQQSKPVYRASLTFDKLFYTFGDTITLTLKATFYDGTPAPGLEFTLYGNYFIQNTVTLKTGVDGTAEYVYKTAPYDFYTTYPVQLSAEAYLIGNEDTSVSVSGYVPYFQSKVWLRESRITPEDGGDTYSEVYLNYFDTSVLKAKEDLEYPLYPENTLGKTAPGSANVRLIEYKYIKEYASTTYDPITKTSQINYNYSVAQKDLKKHTTQFANGVIRLDHVKPEEGFNGYYMYEVSYYDSANKCNYVLNIYANTGDGEIYKYENYEYYELKSDKSAYNVGDTATAVLNYGGKPVDSGHLLFTVYSDRLDLYSSTEKNSFALIFEDKDAAGLVVLAAHFDGRRVQAAGYLNLTFNYAENNVLNTVIIPDKTEYRPGETAKVTVNVTAAAGKPVTGGLITLSMVDEACFTLGQQTLNPLQDYYSGGSKPIPYIGRDMRFSCFGGNFNYYGFSRADGVMESAPQAAGMGGPVNDTAKSEEAPADASAAGVTVREIFADNPLFETYAVSNNGKAEITLTVPDNITEWRFTAVAAYNPDQSKISGMNMGSVTTGVICTLPFFVDATLGDTYIEGDDIAGHARVYGSSLIGGSTVNYTVQLTDSTDQLINEIKIDGKAGEFARFNFGSYESGSYNITVKAVNGTLSDGVKLPVEITSSGIMVNVRREISPAEIAGLNPLMYPVSLTFTDSAYETFFLLCHSLMRKTSRSDALAAYYAAALVSEKLSGTSEYVSKELDTIKATLSGYTGFIPLLAYSQGDIRLTAKICAIIPEALTSAKKTELAGLFTDTIKNRSYTDDADMCAAYLGLAALGEPVLGDLYYVAENSGGFTAEAMLYIAAALAYVGDYSAASEYYQYIMTFHSASEENEMFIKSDKTEENIKLTALALMTASVVDTDGAALMANYLSTHTSTVNLYDLELASYVRYYFPAEAKKAVFSYSIGDTTEEITLSPGQYYNLTLDRRDFTAFKLLSADESVIVYAAYRGSAQEAYGSGEVTDNLKITKSIEPYDAVRGLYKVTLSYRAVTDRSYAFFSLSDCIPSGARYFGAAGEYGDLYEGDTYTFAYISNNGTQVMDGYIGLFNHTENAISGLKERTIEGSVSYIIRAAFEGTFVIENAIVQNTSTGSYTVSNRGSVVIDNDGWKIE